MSSEFITGDSRTKLVQLNINDLPFVIASTDTVKAQLVSKDKAKQQIEMGKKLIALQDLSRQWTNKLMNVSSDASDPNASNELMKTMTLVKSETDAIATSQKLISQMMEEFAQVTETLTNTTKSALETAGRIGRTVSRFSG